MLKWSQLYNECINCNKCPLVKDRTNMVFGEGNINAPIIFIGEAPGADEDRTGRPFVGKAGQLLTKALLALEFKRDEHYYICNVCKCRPENNRTPKEEEARECLPFLRNQVALVKPKIIVCLGATPLKYIMGERFRITRDRGKWIERKGYNIMATFHPAALFRDESKKKLFWQDLKSIKVKYDELIKNNII
ncbi:uracil-DNA glycosylase [Clostridium botulinum]|uniref:uracil-DNA glycosylase n=1 Tax=Clostridium botulinum TaxID=1491 RepID=UPI003DA1E9EC